MQLGHIDLNLLIALDILLEERHVTRSARRLGVTQSAMSQTLQRLRDTLDDPLLVRSGARMVATPRAESMRAPLRAALQALDHVVVGAQTFDPLLDARRFRLASLDIYAPSILPALLARLADAGPRLELEVVDLKVDHIFDQMRQGTVELALLGPRTFPSDVRSERLLHEELVSMVRSGHPILDSALTLADYVAWPHVVFRITGRGPYPIDLHLEERGYSRRIVGHLPYFSAAPAVAAASSSIVTVPRSAAEAFAAHWPIGLFSPPLGSPASYWLSSVWPTFLDADPGIIWLRQQLREITADLAPAP